MATRAAERLRRGTLGLLCVLVVGAMAPLPVGAESQEAERRALRTALARALTDEDPGRDRFDAEVWLHSADASLARFLRAADERAAVLEPVWREANRHGIDPEFALALIEVESAFDRFALSSAGAQGLMQVMPFWKRELGREEDNLADPTTNVRYGMAILAHYLDREDGDPVAALTRYHGARRDLSYPERVYRAWNTRWRTRTIAEARDLVAACYAARLSTCDARP